MMNNITRVVGSCETPYKKRFANHKKSFNNDQCKNETKLSKELWNLKTTNNNSKIAWKIVRRCVPVNRAILRCNLCLNEKLEIATHQGKNLNKRTPNSFLNTGISINFYQ